MSTEGRVIAVNPLVTGYRRVTYSISSALTATKQDLEQWYAKEQAAEQVQKPR
jgi:hypothetical protein